MDFLARLDKLRELSYDKFGVQLRIRHDFRTLLLLKHAPVECSVSVDGVAAGNGLLSREQAAEAVAV